MLLIEDDPDVLENLKDILEYYGYYVTTAKDGLEGYEKALDQLPDLIICDINLPEIDGFELLDMLKRNPDTYIIPFIFLTAMTDKSYLRKGMNLGADDYITKPYENKDIINAVQSKIDKYSDLRNRFTRNLEFLKDRITTSIPKHFSEPILSILGFTSVLKNNYNNFSDHERLSIIQNIFETGDIMQRMLDDYGLYLKINETSYEDLDVLEDEHSIATIINDVLEKECALLGIAKQMLIYTEPAMVMMNSLYTKKIITELAALTAILSYTNETITFNCSRKEEFYNIEVSFQSRGLTSSIIECIGNFDMYEGRDIEGLYATLSLSTIKLITEAHKGIFDIENKFYEQTIIRISLPCL